MGDSKDKKLLTLLVQGESTGSIHTALSLMRSGVALDMDVQAFFTSQGLKWLNRTNVSKELTLLRDTKKTGGLSIYVCSESMAQLGIKKDDLVDEVDKVAGFVHFLSVAIDADVSLAI
ncbi:MAG: DsrE/DsrF/DrsH-like family protein [Nitrososphaerales archaeon]